MVAFVCEKLISGGILKLKDNIGGRESYRLEGYDYSNEGAYYVTLVAYEHRYIFGKVASGVVLLTELGQIVYDEWFKSSNLRSEIELYDGEFIVMPNHIHGIVWIDPGGCRDNGIKKSNQPLVRATGRLPIHNAERNEPGPRSKSLSAFVAGYKSAVTKRINQLRRTPGQSIWMRNFHDRVIRNERELIAIRDYIQNNPLKWELDRNYIE